MAVTLASGLPAPAEARAIRERAGWTRQRMAIELGTSESTLVRWEVGECGPSSKHVVAYMQLLARLDRQNRGQRQEGVA